MLTSLSLAGRQCQWSHRAKEVRQSLRSGPRRLKLGQILKLRWHNAIHLSFGVSLALEHDSYSLVNLSPTFLIYNVEIKLVPHRVVRIK